MELEWTQEYDNAHHADWSTHTWQFYALEGEGGPEAVLSDAVEFCTALLCFAEDDESEPVGPGFPAALPN